MSVLFIHRHPPLPFPPPAFTPPSPPPFPQRRKTGVWRKQRCRKNKAKKNTRICNKEPNPGLPNRIVIKKKLSKNNKETCPLFEDLPERIFSFGPILCTTKSQSRAAFFLVLSFFLGGQKRGFLNTTRRLAKCLRTCPKESFFFFFCLALLCVQNKFPC